jgi:hypothetical protein
MHRKTLLIFSSATTTAFVKIYFRSNYGKHGDFLYDSTDLTIWTTVETCVAIVAACIPASSPYSRPFSKVLHTSTRTSRKLTTATSSTTQVQTPTARIGQ